MIRLCEVLQTVSRNTDGRFALHKMMLYFAYGSNMSLRRIQARTPSARVIDTAQLFGHEIRFHKKSWKDGSAKCDIFYTGKVQDVVFGVVFEINLVERPLLDEAEGLHNGYECKTIDVEITTGETLQPFVYYATAIDAGLLPFTWYREHVVRGARENELPENYIRSLEQVQAMIDPDKKRHERELSLYR